MVMMPGGSPRLLSTLAKSAVVIVGELFTIGTVSSATINFISSVRQKKYGLLCGVCERKGFYRCKLCKGNSTIEWSPLVQHCLNCLGKCYINKQEKEYVLKWFSRPVDVKKKQKILP